MTFIDLSHPIEDGMAAYPGLPPVRIFAILDHDASRERYGGQAEFLLGGAELAGNTGTYLDAPFHRFRDREDLARLPLETVVGLPFGRTHARNLLDPAASPLWEAVVWSRTRSWGSRCGNRELEFPQDER